MLGFSTIKGLEGVLWITISFLFFFLSLLYQSQIILISWTFIEFNTKTSQSTDIEFIKKIILKCKISNIEQYREK